MTDPIRSGIGAGFEQHRPCEAVTICHGFAKGGRQFAAPLCGDIVHAAIRRQTETYEKFVSLDGGWVQAVPTLYGDTSDAPIPREVQADEKIVRFNRLSTVRSGAEQ